MIPAPQAWLSLLGLKLSSTERKSHVMDLVFDEGLALTPEPICSSENKPMRFWISSSFGRPPVLRVKAPCHRDLITVVGSSPTVCAGEWLTAEGAWVRDKEHGLQLKATALRTVPPTTKEGIERYLGSGMVKGIGPIFAKRMVGRFGADILAVIEHRSGGTGDGGRHRTQAPSKDQTGLGGGKAGP